MSSSDGAGRLSLLTPEHVPVGFAVADLGTRAAAVVFDFLLLGVTAFGAVFGATLFLPLSRHAGEALVLVVLFLLRNFYFAFCELNWQGRTPGKRLLRLRVVARDGGPLTAGMIFARNLTRELETFLPLTALMAPESLLAGQPLWARLATVAWIAILTLLPLFNRERARVGDLLAGTAVVFDPQPRLLDDLIEEAWESQADREYTFSQEQLDVYGERELQVLEEVLRRPPSAQRDEVTELIAGKVRRKIGWQGTVQPERFLRAFYAAQRARLEEKMLLGKRRRRKVR